MPKSSKEKIEFARELIQKGISYEEIQQKLKDRYDTGMSNSTLKRLKNKSPHEVELEQLLKLAQQELQETKIELKLYKKMYYELLEAVKDKIMQ